MPEGKHVSSWLTFAGWVLVVAVLYFGRAVLMPIALAALVAFVLAGPVTFLQRLVGRTVAVLITVGLVFALLGGAVWGLGSQLSQLVDDLPGYRTNIREKIGDVREVGNGSVEKLQKTLEDIQTEIDRTGRSRRTTTAVVQPNRVSLWDFPTWISPALGPLSTAGLVVILVVFMLLEREQLRGKLIEMIGSGQMALTTKALDEAGQRVSRQLLMQTLVNAIYGVMVAATLYFMDVPYPFLFGVTGAALRYIPYVGPLRGRRPADSRQPRGAARVGGTAVGHGNLRRDRNLHQHGAGNGPLCRRRRRVASGAAHRGGVLDLAVGTDRAAAGDAAHGVRRGGGTAHTGTGFPVHADDGRTGADERHGVLSARPGPGSERGRRPDREVGRGGAAGIGVRRAVVAVAELSQARPAAGSLVGRGRGCRRSRRHAS